MSELVKIKMLRSKSGSPDGATVSHFEEGKEYETTESLAKSFEDEGVAERVAVEASTEGGEGEGEGTTGKGGKKEKKADA